MSFLIFAISETDGAIVEQDLLTEFDEDVSQWNPISTEATFVHALEKLEALTLTLTRGYIIFDHLRMTLDEMRVIVRCLANMNGKNPETCLQALYEWLLVFTDDTVH